MGAFGSHTVSTSDITSLVAGGAVGQGNGNRGGVRLLLNGRSVLSPRDFG
jgi:hypothetical protein